MLKCNSLNEILRDDDLCIDLNYNKFKIDITIFIFNFFKSLDIHNKLYFPVIIFKNEMEEDYILKGNNIIFINENIIEDIYSNRDKDSMLRFFCNLSKIWGDILINKGIVNIRTINTIKDNLLIEFEEKENRKNKINDVGYYEKNRKKFSSDVYAKLDSIFWFLDYYLANVSIDLKILNSKEIDNIKRKYNNLKKKIKNRNRKITKEIYENEKGTLDDLFDLAISKNPDWLKRYPHLQTEYYIEDNVVKRRDFSQFELSDIDNLNEDNDFKEYVKSLVVRDKYRLIKNDDIGKVKKKQKKN